MSPTQLSATFPITVNSVTQLAAAIEKHPIYVRNNWWLTPSTLRILATAVDDPQPELMRLNDHPLLAAHLTIASMLRLIEIHDGSLRCTHHVHDWLAAPLNKQLLTLHQAIILPLWRPTAEQWHCAERLDLPYQTYLHQQIARYRQSVATGEIDDAAQAMQIVFSEEAWQLHLYPSQPAAQRFWLIQFSDTTDSACRSLTPQSLTTALSNQLALPFIIQQIESAHGQPLKRVQKRQLAAWARQHKRFQLQTVHLLSTQHQADLDMLHQTRRMRQRVHRRIGPRHAIVAEQFEQPLRRWLQRHQIPTTIDAPTTPRRYVQVASEDPNCFLALRTLQKLQAVVGHMQPGLQQTVDNHASVLSDTVQQDCEQRADLLIGRLMALMQTVSEPPLTSVEAVDGLHTLIDTAIAANASIVIHYQGKKDAQPRWREVDPHWRDGVSYLHAFCHRAQDVRQFRLDRIVAAHPLNQPLDPLDAASPFAIEKSNWEEDISQRGTEKAQNHAEGVQRLR